MKVHFAVFAALVFLMGCTSQIEKPFVHKSFLTGQNCDALSGCPEGLQCISFGMVDDTLPIPMCTGLAEDTGPCSIVKCPSGKQCAVLESYPPQVRCS